MQLENIPGYSKGEIPQYLVKLQRSLLQVNFYSIILNLSCYF